MIGDPLSSWLNFGQFGLFNPQASSKRKALNRLVRLILYFTTVKLAIILLAAIFGFPDLKFWLIELQLLFDENQQKFIDVAILVAELGVNLSYSYWIGLDEKALNSLRFLQIPDDKKARSRYEQHYQLDQRSIDKFFAVYRLSSAFLKLAISAYSIFTTVVIARCLYHSFQTVSLVYALSVGTLLMAVSSIAYSLINFIMISRFVLLFLSTEFFIYRLKAINDRLSKRFAKESISVCHRLTKKFISVSGPKEVWRQRASLRKVLHLLNDFCQQFQAINSVLDASLSMFLVGALTFLFVLPYFLFFVENELSIRLFFCCIAATLYMFCFSFSICNDRLRRQVGSSSCSKFHKLKSN